MPTPRSKFHNKRSGSVKNQILQLLSEGQGFYQREIIFYTQCTNNTVIYRALSDLQKEGKITSKTTPQEGTRNAKLYYATDAYLEQLRAAEVLIKAVSDLLEPGTE